MFEPLLQLKEGLSTRISMILHFTMNRIGTGAKAVFNRSTAIRDNTLL
jgi:hypothetical protein